MTTGFLLLSFKCFVVLMMVKAGVLTMKECVRKCVDRVGLARARPAVVSVAGRQRVKVRLLVSGLVPLSLPALGPHLREAGGGGAQATGAVLAGVPAPHLQIVISLNLRGQD